MDNLTVRLTQPGTLYAKSLNYADFIFSTGTEIANAIVKRDANGYANFTTARTVAGASAIYATATGGTGTFAIDASGTNGSNGFAARSVSGTAALLTSGSGIGAQINSNTGSDIASFQNASATVFAVERVNGVLRWIKDGNTGRLTPATLTAACTWTLPDGGGAVAVNLGNVNNTSDTNKPVSAVQQTALNLKANLSGATFTGAISATNLSGTNTGDLTAGTGINITAGVVSSTVTHTGTAAPVDPDNGDVWFDTEDGSLSVWFATEGVWVEISGASGVDGVDGADYSATVTDSTATSGTLTGLPLVDETIYHHPGSTIDSLTFTLPSSANSREGQVKTFFSASIITTFTLGANGNTVVGAALTTTLAGEAYSWQCVTPGTWIRLA